MVEVLEVENVLKTGWVSSIATPVTSIIAERFSTNCNAFHLSKATSRSTMTKALSGWRTMSKFSTASSFLYFSRAPARVGGIEWPKRKRRVEGPDIENFVLNGKTLSMMMLMCLKVRRERVKVEKRSAHDSSRQRSLMRWCCHIIVEALHEKNNINIPTSIADINSVELQ